MRGHTYRPVETIYRLAGQGRSKSRSTPDEAGQSWSKLVKLGQLKLVQERQSCHSWAKPIKAGQSRSKPVKAPQSRLKPVKAGHKPVKAGQKYSAKKCATESGGRYPNRHLIGEFTIKRLKADEESREPRCPPFNNPPLLTVHQLPSLHSEPPPLHIR